MNWITIALIALLSFAYHISDSFGDVAIETGKQKEWHFWGALQAGMFLVVLSFAFYGITWTAAIVCVALVVLRFPVFNLLHNLRKGDPWYYLSDKGIDGYVKRLLKIR